MSIWPMNHLHVLFMCDKSHMEDILVNYENILNVLQLIQQLFMIKQYLFL